MKGDAGERAGESEATGEGEPSSFPAAVRERFEGYEESALLDPLHRDFFVARLMEEGDGAELRWLVRTYGRGVLASLIARRGGRALSRRSRAFWERVLSVRSAPRQPLAHELWPLA